MDVQDQGKLYHAVFGAFSDAVSAGLSFEQSVEAITDVANLLNSVISLLQPPQTNASGASASGDSGKQPEAASGQQAERGGGVAPGGGGNGGQPAGGQGVLQERTQLAPAMEAFNRQVAAARNTGAVTFTLDRSS